MKSKLLFVFFLFFTNYGFAETINIKSKNITIDKNQEVSIFRNEVQFSTEDNKIIKSEFAEYNKIKGIIKLKQKVKATDNQNNQILAEHAEYNDKTKVFKTFGATEVITSEKYILKGEDLILDEKNFIKSDKSSTLSDADGNKIYLENFIYQIKEKIFKSIGSIKIEDKFKNNYEFSQIYIDTKKKELLGTDIKSYINNERFKVNKKNKPRIFANTVKIKEKENLFNKSVFTICDYRENDKCPPWTIQASKMLHDNIKKTIYYDNALIKIYDIPVFYFPKLAHPDPSVKRRSGFLVPTFTDTKNLGASITIPYFWDLGMDKNLTLTSRLFSSENPIFLGEYHQAFKSSNWIADFGYTEGYKKTTSKKKSGDKSHFFSKFTKNFNLKDNSNNSLDITLQHVSDDKYFKLYDIKTNLINKNIDTLENSISFTHEEEDIFFGVNANIYETLKDNYVDKYEYTYPEITFDTNLFSNNTFGNLDLQTNYKTHKYDTNKFTNFLVNDLNWDYRENLFDNGFVGRFLGNLKNINYETRNVETFKEDSTNEIYGSLGYLSKINLQRINDFSNHLLTPKMLLRYAPGGMRKEEDGFRLDPIRAFSLNRLDNVNNYETGLTSTIGVDYEYKNNNNNFNFSVAQIINAEENKKMPSKSSMDEKLSDLVGFSSIVLDNKFKLNYNFALDQNFEDLNYSEVGSEMKFKNLDLNFSYLEENKHIGNQEYFNTKIEYLKNENNLFSFETKRNLITQSAEFYNMSYEYLNDCLRAGLVYRREFYTDSELEPANSLMFKITLIPFGNVNSPAFNR